ncbi:MAG: HD-GYP domain-containing protein [Phycisphaerales bacterium]|nr:HD-GYP domain-containing protein [Planctomycetota bacterium]MCH8507784.1 HD-GYP domain-containing protein [Phycisphaerales bacterium]
MTATIKPRHRPTVPPAFVDRCRELGLVTWRLDPNGMPVEDPAAPELVALWLSSKPFRRVLTELASGWSARPKLSAANPMPGMWVYPFEELHRRRRTGYFIAIGFGKEILESDLLEPGCVGGSLQLGAVKHALYELATIDGSSAKRLSRVLGWMHEDLVGGYKSAETIEGFTEQLATAYEAVTMLCELGRAMGSIDDPESFVRQTGEQVGSTLMYRWTTICLDGRDGRDDRIFEIGQERLGEERVRAVLGRIELELPTATAGTTAIYQVDDASDPLSPQIVSHPIERNGRRFGLMIAGGKLGDDPQVSTYETKSIESVCGLLGAFLENADLYEEQRLSFIGTIRAMSGALDAKDRYTRGHSDRVAYMSAEIARALGFSDEEVERVRIAGIVHDVGKIGVPESVLCKPDRLTDEEFDLIKKHPEIGHQILEGIPGLKDILPGVLYHHERYDGKGYPHGLAGDDIPLLARIMAVADTFDAMSSNRAYRSKMPREVVLGEIAKCAGTQFDQRVAEAFLGLDLTEYDRMVADHAGQDSLGKAA